jgi:hypothetical protein
MPFDTDLLRFPIHRRVYQAAMVEGRCVAQLGLRLARMLEVFSTTRRGTYEVSSPRPFAHRLSLLYEGSVIYVRAFVVAQLNQRRM